MSLLLDFARWETDLPRLERHQAGEMTEHDYEVQAARMAEVNGRVPWKRRPLVSVGLGEWEWEWM